MTIARRRRFEIEIVERYFDQMPVIDLNSPQAFGVMWIWLRVIWGWENTFRFYQQTTAPNWFIFQMKTTTGVAEICFESIDKIEPFITIQHLC